MNRRQLLLAPLLLAGVAPAGAHTPYGQWVVYRKKHLLIGSHRADPATYVLAKKLAGVLAEHLPKSESRAARAPTAERLASLLGTDQLDVAVLGEDDAVSVFEGSGKYRPYGAIAIRQIATMGAHLLVAHERLPDRHAWLVAATLHANHAVDANALLPDSKIGWHPGGLAYYQGLPEPVGD